MSKRRPKPRNIHIKLFVDEIANGMHVSFDADIGELPEVVCDVLNQVSRVDMERQESPRVGFQPKEKKDEPTTIDAGVDFLCTCMGFWRDPECTDHEGPAGQGHAQG